MQQGPRRIYFVFPTLVGVVLIFWCLHCQARQVFPTLVGVVRHNGFAEAHLQKSSPR